MISNFMSGTAPLSIPSTHPHHTKASGVSDPKDPSDPNVCDNLPCALLPKPATPRARCATPPSVPAPHNCPPETPTQNSVLYLSRCGSLPACQSASRSVQTLSFATITPPPAPASAPLRHPRALRSTPLLFCPTEFDRAPIRCDGSPSSSRSHFRADCSNGSSASSHPTRCTRLAAADPEMR